MKEVLVRVDDGAAFGYITSLKEPNFSNYLEEHLEKDPKSEFLSYCETHIQGPFTLLQNINLEAQAQGKGAGQKLLEKFLQASEGPVLLICDNLERQRGGFNLHSWYENFGFEPTGHQTLSGPILIRF